MEKETDVEFTCEKCGHQQKETISIEIEPSDSYMDFDWNGISDFGRKTKYFIGIWE